MVTVIGIGIKLIDVEWICQLLCLFASIFGIFMRICILILIVTASDSHRLKTRWMKQGTEFVNFVIVTVTVRTPVQCLE